VAKDRIGSIAALLQRKHADAVGVVEANSLANIETLRRELSMVMYGEANSPACVAWLSRLPIRSSTNHWGSSAAPSARASAAEPQR